MKSKHPQRLSELGFSVFFFSGSGSADRFASGITSFSRNTPASAIGADTLPRAE